MLEDLPGDLSSLTVPGVGIEDRKKVANHSAATGRPLHPSTLLGALSLSFDALSFAQGHEPVEWSNGQGFTGGMRFVLPCVTPCTPWLVGFSCQLLSKKKGRHQEMTAFFVAC